LNNVLIVVAHPDDEVLGVGGTSLRHAENGDTVFTLIMCNPRDADNFEMISAGDLLKTDKVFNMQYPDQQLEQEKFTDIVTDIEGVIEKYNINIVYTHTHKDLNRDHQIVNEAVLVATRPIPESKITKVLAFETPSSTEWNFNSSFSPNYFIDITGTIIIKLKALAAYVSEIRQYPHPRSIENVENLSRIRGCSIGYRNAEAFEVIRITE